MSRAVLAGVLLASLAAACAGGPSPSPGATVSLPASPPAESPTAEATETAGVSPSPSPEPSPTGSPAVATGSPVASPTGSPAASPATTITVTGVDYAFEGVPTSVPAGTSFSFTNAGTELHELVVMRKNEGVTESFQEILALPEEEGITKVTVLGGVVAGPGESAPAPVPVSEVGEYVVICFIPQGTTTLPEPTGSPSATGLASPDATATAAATVSPEATGSPSATGEASPGATGFAEGPPHFILGMWQEFAVTEAGSTPGPIATPGAASPGTSPALESPSATDGASPEASPSP